MAEKKQGACNVGHMAALVVTYYCLYWIPKCNTRGGHEVKRGS